MKDLLKFLAKCLILLVIFFLAVIGYFLIRSYLFSQSVIGSQILQLFGE